MMVTKEIAEQLLSLISADPALQARISSLFPRDAGHEAVLRELAKLREDFQTEMGNMRSDLQREVGTLRADLQARMDQFEKSLQLNQARMDQFEKSLQLIHARMDQYERTQLQFQARMDQFEKTLQQVQARMDQFEKAQQQFQARMDQFEKTLQQVQARMDQFERALQKFGERMHREISGLGARWGIYAEESFRQAMDDVIREHFGGDVRPWRMHDSDCVVRAYPSDVEVDLLIRDGKHLLLEVKSSASGADVEELSRVGTLYAKLTGVKPDLAMVTPAATPRAEEAAQRLQVKLFTHL